LYFLDQLLQEKQSPAFIQFLLEYLNKLTEPPDVLYTTTRFLTLNQLTILKKIGFKIGGIFPAALGADISGINGIAIYYFTKEVLSEKRNQHYF